MGSREKQGAVNDFRGDLCPAMWTQWVEKKS